MLSLLQASGFQQVADHTQAQGRGGMMAGTKGTLGLDEDGRPAGKVLRIRQPRRQDHKMVTATHRREELTPGRQPVGLLQLGKSAFRSRTVCFSSCCSRSRKSFCSQWTRKRVSPVGRLCSSQPKGTSRASRPVAQS